MPYKGKTRNKKNLVFGKIFEKDWQGFTTQITLF